VPGQVPGELIEQARCGEQADHHRFPLSGCG
jgi:hypothetical protein